MKNNYHYLLVFFSSGFSSKYAPFSKPYNSSNLLIFLMCSENVFFPLDNPYSFRFHFIFSEKTRMKNSSNVIVIRLNTVISCEIHLKCTFPQLSNGLCVCQVQSIYIILYIFVFVVPRRLQSY